MIFSRLQVHKSVYNRARKGAESIHATTTRVRGCALRVETGNKEIIIDKTENRNFRTDNYEMFEF